VSSHPKQRHSPYAVLGYRFLLRLYPREFRERYGRDLVELIEDSLCGEGRYSVTRWARTILNLATNALRVRLDAIWNAARSNPKRTFNMRIDSALQDLRFGMRMLRKHPGLSLIVILTFGLGIGYTSTVFNITSGFVHKELPFEDSERILSLDRTDPAHPIQYGDLTVPVHDFLEWRAQQTSFERLAAYRTESKNLSTGEGRPERHKSGWITTGVFETLRVQPLLGRTFVEGEELPGAEKVIVLGYDLWLNRFDGATDILGRTVFVDAVPRTVIGVMPEGFTFPLAEQFWLPAELDPSAFQRGDGPRYAVIARLEDGVSAGQAEAQLATIAARLAREYPESNEGLGVAVTTLRGRLIPPAHYALFYTMLGATLGVLLIGCANIANLLLARASVRAREVAVRSALGASRSRLITQLLTEVLVLAVIGGSLGLMLGYLGLDWFVAKMTYVLVNAGDGEDLPFWIHFEHDYRMLLFVVGATVLSSVFAGVLPALRSSAANPGEAMKVGSRGSQGLKLGRFTGGLVTAEVATSCVLLILAGLMIKSVTQLSTVDLPFATENVFSARVRLPQQDYPDPASRLAFSEQLYAGLEAIPGRAAMTLSNALPGPGYGSTDVRIEGQTYEADEDLPRVHTGWVTPGYFDTFESGVLQGRVFTMADHGAALPVAVVNETFARIYLAGDAIGRRIRMLHDDARWLTVVGVVPDMYMDMFGTGGNPAGFYTPMVQNQVGSYVAIAIRTQGPPMAIERDVRRAIAAIDPHLPAFRVLPMTGVMLRMTWFYPVFSRMFMIFGFTALFLGAIGLYGVMSFAVTQRTREMGIRMALGAQSGKLVGLVMRKGVIQMVIGLGIGLTLALFTAGPLQLVLYEVNGRDPAVFGTVTATLALTCLLASFVPAYRVTKVDPVTALTSE
jgi:predicted permease